MNQEKSAAYKIGWNAFIDGKGTDDNPWTMTSKAGQDWDEGHNAAYFYSEKEGGIEKL